MSAPHAILESQCAACHIQKASFFSAKAENEACLACHDGPIHHAGQVTTADCATCHMEHRGRINISAVSEKSCAACHADLKVSGTPVRYSTKITSFTADHPEFSVIREHRRDSTTLKLNHAVHMKPIRRGPSGPVVQLACGDCHRPAVAKATWTYSDANYLPSTVTTAGTDAISAQSSSGLEPHHPSTGRELMAPVSFAHACASCHLLSFDKRFNEGVPHDKPEVIHAWLQKKYAAYVATHAGELHSTREPDRDLAGRPLAPRTQTLTTAQWVAARTADAEQLLWRKTCLQCHQLLTSEGLPRQVSDVNSNAASAALPRIAESRVTSRWMPHATFDHEAHDGFTCTNCHEKALQSVDSADLLMPGIKTCQTCHAPGADHAESRCYECHTYHDWSKRKEVTPRFTMPSLTTGGR